MPLAKLTALLALAILVAGCIQVPDAPAADVDAAPLHESGRVMLPSSDGLERERSEIHFPVNHSAFHVTAELRLEADYGALPAPPATMADIVAQLVDVQGAVVDEARLGQGAPREATLSGTGPEGRWSLVLLSYGGSDGARYGDYVEYTLRAA